MDAKIGGRLGTKIFCRLLSLDFQCPGCGEIHKLGLGRPGEKGFDRITQRFNCYKCRLSLALGVVAYSPPHGRATPASDQILSKRAKQELANQVVSAWIEGERGEQANLKVEP